MLGGERLAPPAEPARRPLEHVLPSVPPLPKGAEQVSPITVELEVVRKPADGEAQRAHHVVTRTVDRIHVAVEGGPEWLFERNAIDPRRVSGVRVDHEEKVAIFYSDTDLRNMRGIPGWAHVLTLGLDEQRLAGPVASHDARTISGLRFTRMQVRDNEGQGSDVWWNQEHLLAAVSSASGSGGWVQTTIRRVTAIIDRRLLESTAVRFPQFRQVDLAEWLEHR